MFDIRREPMRDCWQEIEQLCREHYDEIALHQDSIPLDPDWHKYLQLEKAGCLLLMTARMGSKLVGYSIFFLMPHIHYKSTVCAMNDVLFISKPFRKGTLGLKLMRAAERDAVSCGAKKVAWHVKDHYDFSPILRRWGYSSEEQVWGKCFRQGSE